MPTNNKSYCIWGNKKSPGAGLQGQLMIMWCSVRQKLGRENRRSHMFVSNSLNPTRNFEFPIGKAIRFWYKFTSRKVDVQYNTPNFPSGKLGIPSEMETIGHKQLGAPIFPSQFPMHWTPHKSTPYPVAEIKAIKLIYRELKCSYANVCSLFMQ